MQNFKTMIPRKRKQRRKSSGPKVGKEFLDMMLEAQSEKEKIHKLEFIKIKNLHSVDDTVKRMKRQATEWEKILANHMSNKGLVSLICKELSKRNTKKKANNPIKK